MKVPGVLGFAARVLHDISRHFYVQAVTSCIQASEAQPIPGAPQARFFQARLCTGRQDLANRWLRYLAFPAIHVR